MLDNAHRQMHQHDSTRAHPHTHTHTYLLITAHEIIFLKLHELSANSGDGSINQFLIPKTLWSNWCVFIWPEEINQDVKWEEWMGGGRELWWTEGFEGHRIPDLILCALSFFFISPWSTLIKRIECPCSHFKGRLSGFAAVSKLTTMHVFGSPHCLFFCRFIFLSHSVSDADLCRCSVKSH